MKPSCHPRLDQQPGFAPHHNSRRERVRLAAIAGEDRRKAELIAVYQSDTRAAQRELSS